MSESVQQQDLAYHTWRRGEQYERRGLLKSISVEGDAILLVSQVQNCEKSE